MAIFRGFGERGGCCPTTRGNLAFSSHFRALFIARPHTFACSAGLGLDKRTEDVSEIISLSF